MSRQRRPADSVSDAEFEAFFLSRRQLYWRIAFAIVGTRATAEDVVQETFSAIYARWSRIQATTVDAYCRTMLVNASLGAVRRRRREHPVDPASWLVDEGGSSTDPVRGRASRLDLLAALRDLSPGYRAVVALRYLEDLPVAEVASTLGISEGTVKSQTARALTVLRRHLEADDDLSPSGTTQHVLPQREIGASA